MSDYNDTIDQIIQSLTDICRQLRALKVKPRCIESESLKIGKFKKLIYRSSWPEAIPTRSLININSDYERLRYSETLLDLILERELTGRSFLVWKCGSGDIVVAGKKLGAEVSVGYDVVSQGWGRFSQENIILTTHIPRVYERQYDAILVDPIDSFEDPITTLKEIHTLAAPNSLVYVIGRPWSGRAALGHENCRILNKAYAHLFLTIADLDAHGCIGLPLHKVFKTEEYHQWFNDLFKVRREKIYSTPIEKIFKTPALSPVLQNYYPGDDGLWDRLAITSVVYTLEPIK